MAENMQLATEFQALPLQYIIAAPLKGVIEAQKVAAETTLAYINSMIKNGKPITVDFTTSIKEGDKSKSVDISAPLLSIVPVPHIRIDSFTTNFRFEISQVDKSASSNDKGVEAEVKVGGNPWVNASIKGSISSKSSQESIMNRSGALEITVHASESPVPEGLAKVLTILANSITSETASTGK